MAIALLFAIVTIVTGCRSPTPYVFTEREFDRSSPEFNKDPLDRSSVTICMSPFADPSGESAALADQECQKYGKKARFSERRFGACPLLSSSAAVFHCVFAAPSSP